MVTTNKHEIRVYGIKRSGNHAIIYWIFKHFNGAVVHLNNVGLTPDPDPYKSFALMSVKGMSFWKCKPKITSFLKYQINQPTKMIFVRVDPKVNIEYIRAYRPKECLILSFENKIFDSSSENLCLSNRDYSAYVGESERVVNIVILRDAYNLFASLLKSKMMRSKNCSKFVNLFKQYARIHLGESSTFPDPTICINYNQWCVDNNYRVDVANKIGFNTSGSPFLEVEHFGGGSSFDKLAARRNPQKLQNTAYRWRSFIDDPLYRSIFQDEELRYLSTQVFGNYDEIQVTL
ncbi:MAG: hypothetical protein SW833_01525 [Cyanobacteriota bacterium]|nr:hypothetical protein [Cyanobacteriota bacterium]